MNHRPTFSLKIFCIALLLFCLSFPCTSVLAAPNDPIHTPNMAFNDPDQFAWHLFAAVNRPAKGGSNQALWQTWAEQSVVYANPCVKPIWPGADANNPLHGQGSRLVSILNKIANSGVVADDFNLLTGDQNVQQVKLNKPFFNYVVDHDLWYQEGVIRQASTEGIDFPADAIVYKADWVEIEEQDKARYHWRLVSQQDYDEALGGKGPQQSTADADNDAPVLLGLLAFHIVSKTLDNWVWTTWNQADTLGRCDYIGCRDEFGSDPAYVPPHREMGQPYTPGKLTPAARRVLAEAGLDQVWYHYRLMGTQVTFTASTGRPNVLGNAVLEPTFGNTSSCLTCHSMATLSAAGTSLSFLKSIQPFEGFVGTPDPSWYYPAHAAGVATPIVYQTDFMWQLATEAQTRAGTECDPSNRESGSSSEGRSL